MESVYHIVAIRVNETSWAHVWRLHFRYLGTGFDNGLQHMRLTNLQRVQLTDVLQIKPSLGWYIG
jgi:hypothetical protein